MLNTTNINKTKINIQACSGGIYRSCKESQFVRFHVNSRFAEKLMDEKEGSTCIILQMILHGNDYLIAEIIDEKKYQDMFDNK